jgi:hypothetical protein
MRAHYRSGQLKIKSPIPEELTEWDEEIYNEITSTDLSDDQKQEIRSTPRMYPREEHVLAIHWHPEQVPLDLVEERIDKTFPNKRNELIIPTQHNMILHFNGYAGAEVDCYSREFKRKVQLLLHFKEERLEGADKLKSMIDHTFRYRAGQLFEFMDTILDTGFEGRLQLAARETSADKALIQFVRIYTEKLKKLLDHYELTTPPIMIKNKLLREYFDKLRAHYDSALIDRAQIFLKAVKNIVKANFNTDYFYETRQIIEEARKAGACIVVPHPEQFWPILLADYDVDGFEVWNPQSQDYTEFLVGAVHRLNGCRLKSALPILVTMGDDCHLGEKLKPRELQDEVKAAREIGLQPAWQDLSICKKLILHDIRKEDVINEYRNRLDS